MFSAVQSVWIAVDKQCISCFRVWKTAISMCFCFLPLIFTPNLILHMPAAGYSGTPLLRKLGIKSGWKLRLIGAPVEYFHWLEEDLSGAVCGPRIIPDFVHLFAVTRRDFEREMAGLVGICGKNPMVVIWVSWYKKSSGKATDLTEDVIRGYALANGLVDIKVCAVSEEWSGLKLVVPVAKR